MWGRAWQNTHMVDVTETALPGVGIRFEFTTDDGSRLGLVHHRTGRRELVVYRSDDPDTVQMRINMDSREARTLGELLGVSKVAEDIEHMTTSVEGLAIDWLPIVEGTTYAGRTIGDTQARTRTGVSVVAVVRGDQATPAPGPDFGIEAGDTLVVVGTPRGIEALAVILRTS